jgi:AcrR family transcriptional regulator
MKQGRRPTLEEVAEEAFVSRATAYRYFPNADALLLEASFDVAIPGPDELFRDGPQGDDPAARLDRVDAALHDATVANEASLRMMLSQSVLRALDSGGDGATPVRQDRRTPLIEAALEPARGRFEPAALDRLAKAVALLVGPEAIVVAKDVLQLDDAETRQVKRWAIHALAEAAQNPHRGD